MNGPGEYEAFLAGRGRSLTAAGVNEVALRRADALDAIRWLREKGLPILGGDVWLERDGTLDLSYDNWYAESEPGESTRSSLEGTWTIAEEFITRYPAETSSKPWFVLVVGPLRQGATRA